MKFYEAESTINASPEQIWPVLIDTEHWASWDSGVVSVSGPVALGAKFKVVAEAAPDRAFPVKVTTVDAPHRLVIVGGAPLGLFKGERTFTLTPVGEATEFTIREEYTGPLLGAIWKSIPDLGPSFKQFANGLKKRAESGA
ncbi:Polyketide cyclase / dehydrase and lipid transport [Microbacterium sp. cf046]|uniref:SRPBCC domain-containing protein n=1 Tax=Microbacterium sp. cf046 TaxID=1761803 RepID=UPI0008F07374|nr:SRPBCC domain-containing protein [Microbacterium sp. cf046]SFS16165.1 Polyketide cyclase / dehydrase and lipid transport [Microbacterium sp. cf046]